MALVAWYKLNGNVLDSTVNGNHGTIVGSPTVVNDGPFGSCYLFNPENGDYITINNLSQFIYNTPFTFSAWIKTSGLGTGQTVNGIVSLTYGTRFCGNSAGNIYIHFLSTSIGSYSITSSGININDNIWHHVCCTYDDDILKLYIDGVLNNSSVTGIVQTNTYTNNGAIGMDTNDSSKYKFNGSISDVRIYDEALSLKEIKELAKAKILHYDFNHDTTDDLVVYDKSGWNNNGIIAEATAPTYVNESIVNNGCYQFDGTNTKYIEINNPFGYTNLTQEWTVSAWIKLDTIDTYQELLNGLNNGLNLIHTSTTKQPLLYLNSGSNDYYMYGATDKIIPDTWLHIVYVFRNSDALRKIYVNGIDISTSGPNLTNTPLGISSTLKLGYRNQGKIADFRIYSTALSSDDIKEIYQTRASIDKNGNIFISSINETEIGLASGFEREGVARATEFSEVGITEGLVAYYPLNGDAKDYSGNGNHGTVYGAIKAGGIAGKKCYYFDGTNDYILINNGLLYGLSEFTIHAYYKRSGTGANECILCSRSVMGEGVSVFILGDGTGSIRLDSGSGYQWTTNKTVSDNEEVFIDYIWTSNIKKLYINGTLYSSTTTTPTSISNLSQTITTIGASQVDGSGLGNYLGGKIQDVRIYNRALSDKEIGILYNTFNPNINKTLQINKENIIYTKGNIKEV